MLPASLVFQVSLDHQVLLVLQDRLDRLEFRVNVEIRV